MPDQIEGDIAEGDVFFEFGRAGDPGTELLGQDERVVAEPQRIFGHVGGGDGRTFDELGVERCDVDGDVAVVVGIRVDLLTHGFAVHR